MNKTTTESTQGMSQRDEPKREVSQSELVLKFVGSKHDGQLIRLKSSSCTIGSAAGCTLRMNAPSIKDVQCIIDRNSDHVEIRAVDPSTLLNGHQFETEHLNVSDRIEFGPIKLAVEELGLVKPHETASGAGAFEARPNVVTSEKLSREMEKVQDLLSRSKQLMTARTRRLVADLTDAREQIARQQDLLLEQEQKLTSFEETRSSLEQRLAQLEAFVSHLHSSDDVSFGDLAGNDCDTDELPMSANLSEDSFVTPAALTDTKSLEAIASDCDSDSKQEQEPIACNDAATSGEVESSVVPVEDEVNNVDDQTSSSEATEAETNLQESMADGVWELQAASGQNVEDALLGTTDSGDSGYSSQDEDASNQTETANPAAQQASETMSLTESLAKELGLPFPADSHNVPSHDPTPAALENPFALLEAGIHDSLSDSTRAAENHFEGSFPAPGSSLEPIVEPSDEGSDSSEQQYMASLRDQLSGLMQQPLSGELQSDSTDAADQQTTDDTSEFQHSEEAIESSIQTGLDVEALANEQAGSQSNPEDQLQGLATPANVSEISNLDLAIPSPTDSLQSSDLAKMEQLVDAFPTDLQPQEESPELVEPIDVEEVTNVSEERSDDAALFSPEAISSPPAPVSEEQQSEVIEDALVVASSANETAAGPEESEEESIEEYMARLLKRVGGGSSTAAEAPKPVDGKSQQSSSKSKSGKKSPSGDESSQQVLAQAFASELEAREKEFAKPRSPRHTSAPERRDDLAAMRELANTSARSAIQTSQRQRESTAANLQLAGFVGSLIFALAMFYVSPAFFSLQTLLGIVALGGSGFLGYRSYLWFKTGAGASKKQSIRSTAEAADQQEAIAGGEPVDAAILTDDPVVESPVLPTALDPENSELAAQDESSHSLLAQLKQRITGG